MALAWLALALIFADRSTGLPTRCCFNDDSMYCGKIPISDCASTPHCELITPKNNPAKATCIDKCGKPDGDAHCEPCCDTNSCGDMWWSCKNCECRPGYDEKRQITSCCASTYRCNFIGAYKDSKNVTTLQTKCCPSNKRGKECSDCQIGRYGPNCEPCKVIHNQVECSGHGRCDGSGFTNGTGNCICERGFLAPDCRLADPNVFHCPGTSKDNSVTHPLGVPTPAQVCSGHGECLSDHSYSKITRDSAYCSCEYHWRGVDNCSTCSRQFTGSTCQLCSYGYFMKDNNDCGACPGILVASDGEVMHVCSGRGHCLNKTRGAKKAGTCHCYRWWMTGDACEKVLFHTFVAAIPIISITVVVIASAISLCVAWHKKDSVWWCSRQWDRDDDDERDNRNLRDLLTDSGKKYKERWSKGTRPTPWGKASDSQDSDSLDDGFVEPLAGHRRTQSGASQQEYQRYSRIARHSISSEYSRRSSNANTHDGDGWGSSSSDDSSDMMYTGNETKTKGNVTKTTGDDETKTKTRSRHKTTVSNASRWTVNSSDAEDDDSGSSSESRVVESQDV